jgi:hypothetical protein
VGVLNSEKADLIFSAVEAWETRQRRLRSFAHIALFNAGDLATSGVLVEAGSVLEVVGLLRSFTPTGGLSLEMSPPLLERC